MTPKMLTLRSRGTITLPAELRKKYRLEEGEPLTLLDLGGVFVLSPKVPLVPKLVGEFERIREEAGLSVEDLLEGLDEKRRELYRERYGRETEAKLRVFFDADGLIADSASKTHSSAVA